MSRQLSLSLPGRPREPLAAGASVLRGYALSDERALLLDIAEIVRLAPFRNMITPGGFRMSVAMTNCGPLGWVSDRRGYRYSAEDPETGRPWPPLPGSFLRLARDAAAAGGFEAFVPDACLVNQYRAGARLTLHQDKNERDFSAPIVSVSLGIPAVFLFGGETRGQRADKIPVEHGDVVVWGGPSRLRYHGVLPLKDDHHPSFGNHRINLTFRKAG